MAPSETTGALQGGVRDRSLPAGPLAGTEGLGADVAAVRKGHVLGPGSSRKGRRQQRPLRSHSVQERLHHRRRTPVNPPQAAQGAVEHDAVPPADPKSSEIPRQAFPGDGSGR